MLHTRHGSCANSRAVPAIFLPYMLAVATPPPTFPDDPRKWDGWRQYASENPYERLCLDAAENPTDEQIQQRCAALVQWWQNKLPLKNQPSNPIAQLLGRGLMEATDRLVQARLELLDPQMRRECDERLAAQAGQDALEEFIKFIGFSIKGGVLPAEAEANLVEFGQKNGLAKEEIKACIENELKRQGARRSKLVAPAPVQEPLISSRADAEKEFLRILCLGGLNMGSASYTVRAMLAQVAENLGIAPARGEHLLDRFLDDQELTIVKQGECKPVFTLPRNDVSPAPEAPVNPVTDFTPRVRPIPTPMPASFANPIGSTMVLLPPGDFIMGSDDPEAQPNEQPLTPVSLNAFYIAQHPVTNEEFERFDPRHKAKRMEGAGGNHPVVYVTSFEALKYCEWLSQKDGKSYRLPTEAEWEFAARGTDGRKYPWGNQLGGADRANFADASTTFAWRDAQINDGYPITSPVGAFPRGASFFAIEDMAGNVWEWCLDFSYPFAGSPKQNPRGPASGLKRLYRGGSWKSRITNLRATARGSNAPNYSCNDLGFRVVCDCA
jgi:formylglycine-generating enzyme required for sulfatase activity